MAKVMTKEIKIDGVWYKYDINVSQEGIFSTTLPTDLTMVFLAAGIDMERNRMGKSGYVSDKTMDGFLGKINALKKLYESYEVVESKIVIEYFIDTRCSYVINEKGEFVPNGYWQKVTNEFGTNWRSGTMPLSVSNTAPFGLSFYAVPFLQKLVKYHNGTTKIFRDRLQNAPEDKIYLHYLCDITHISRGSHNVQYVDYNEQIAKFFVNLYISLFQMNENIKEYLTPDKIRELAESDVKLLG